MCNMKKLAIVIIILPFIFLFTMTGISNYYKNLPDEQMNHGKCIETYTVEHWHKYKAPTTTVHSVVRDGNSVYIVDGNCNNHTKTIPWEQEHGFISFMGFLGSMVLFGLCFVFVIAIIVFWILAILFLFKYDRTKSFKENLVELFKFDD